MEIVESEQIGFSASRLERLDAVMQQYVDQGQLAGLITCIARYGSIAHLANYGRIDLETASPIQFDTLFRIYSMTKPITSVALMMLVEQGMIRLSDPVSRYLPALGRVKVLTGSSTLVELDRAITIHDLLRHTAGMSYNGYGAETRDPVDKLYDEADLWSPGASSQDVVERIAQLPLAYQPGRSWRYSVATDVIGYVIELVSGTTLASFFEDKILKPLGMNETAFSVNPEKADRLATLYTLAPNGTLQEVNTAIGGDFFDVSFFSGGHGLISTTTDYLRFTQFLLNRGQLEGVRLLGPRTVDLMMSNHIPKDILPIAAGTEIMHGLGFGLGFSVMMDVGISGTMGSVGLCSWGGWAKTHFWVDPAEQLIGILMVQQIHTGTHPVSIDFRTLVYQAIIE